jgi:hypothetical protein
MALMKIIYFDLETTDVRPPSNPDIVQILCIGAINECDGNSFLKYMHPTCKINPEASRINGMTIRDGNLYHLNHVIPYKSTVKEGLIKFMDFLGRQSKDGKYEICLIAHNCHGFDQIVLTSNMNRFGIGRPNNCKINFACSMKMASPIIKGGKSLGKCLAFLFDDQQLEIHHVMEDTKDCKRISEEIAFRRGYQDVYDMLNHNQDCIRPMNEQCMPEVGRCKCGEAVHAELTPCLEPGEKRVDTWNHFQECTGLQLNLTERELANARVAFAKKDSLGNGSICLRYVDAILADLGQDPKIQPHLSFDTRKDYAACPSVCYGQFLQLLHIMRVKGTLVDFNIVPEELNLLYGLERLHL